MRFSLFLLDKSQCLFAFPVSSISIHPLYKLILINLTRNALISLISGLVRPFKELCLRHRADTNARMIALVRLVKLFANRVGMHLIHVLVERPYVLTCLSRLVGQRSRTISYIASTVQDEISFAVCALLYWYT